MLNSVASKNLELARRLHVLVSDHPDFEVLLDPTKYLYCFRYVPNAVAARQDETGVQSHLDCLNREIVEAIQRSGNALATSTRIRGRAAIRISICSHGTTEADVDATFESIAWWGRLLSRKHEDESAEVEEKTCLNESCSSPTGVSVI